MSIGHRQDDGEDDPLPPAKPCGECGMCCKILRINVLEKPAGLWCRHFAKSQGCSVHAVAPGECRRFQCYWSISHALGEDWRPDRSKLVIWSNAEGSIIVDVDPSHPASWRREPFHGQLKAWANRDRPAPLEVLIRVGERMLVLFPEGEVDLGPQQIEQAIDSGYHLQNGRKVPYARFVEARC